MVVSRRRFGQLEQQAAEEATTNANTSNGCQAGAEEVLTNTNASNGEQPAAEDQPLATESTEAGDRWPGGLKLPRKGPIPAHGYGRSPIATPGIDVSPRR
jgi:hypothetical protein